MCRFLVYKGKDPILLSHLILDPAHSILTQSYDSRLRLDTRRPHNGDGFGVGYYTPPELLPLLGPDPCIFTSTIPAWNCTNLARLASKTISPLIFAHVRASTEGALAEINCHPFSRGCLMWMHNGGIGSFVHGVKRKLVDDVGDRWFEGVAGSTDTEWAFALFLDSLERLGYDPDATEYQIHGFGHTVLRKAILMVIERINGYIRELPEERRNVSLLNFAVTDGKSVVCTRYVSSRTDEAASLFFSSGTNWTKKGGKSIAPEAKGDYIMERRDRGADIVLVASEPLTFERDNWVTVPTNSTVTIHNQTVLIHPIIDEFYQPSPSFKRSSKLAEKQGQTTTEMATAQVDASSANMSRENSSEDLAKKVSEKVACLGLAAA
ncbi:nucleophile aminohydrolase [Delphinella strobiligena]|nr:nucleophile aminohydrolase [Delphinella strobiligena]